MAIISVELSDRLGKLTGKLQDVHERLYADAPQSLAELSIDIDRLSEEITGALFTAQIEMGRYAIGLLKKQEVEFGDLNDDLAGGGA